MDKGIFTQIQGKRISHLIEDQIKEAIFENYFKVGDKIPPERELAEMFNASRTSVREALRSLEKSGFVEIRRGVLGGAYVTKNDSSPVIESLKDMLYLGQVNHDEIAQVRLALEPMLAAQAAQKAGPKDIARCEEAIQTLERLFEMKDPIIQHDTAIHTLIAEISGNRVFIIIINVLMDILGHRMRNIKLDDKGKKEIVRQHKRIVEAIKNKDKKKAYEAMKSHILKAQKLHSEAEKKTVLK
jgi:GntR family transcriptional repressor for pyruvate dehydrogenase complex